MKKTATVELLNHEIKALKLMAQLAARAMQASQGTPFYCGLAQHEIEAIMVLCENINEL